MNEPTHLSLFTGIGGIDLAAEWAGFRTIGQVEQNPYALRILRGRFGRRIPRWTDIRDLSSGDFKRRTGIDSPTLLSGGFPCQPFSCAGKRRGKEDDRYLWPEMFRVVRELRPAWVLGENVAGIVSMELESCCADLESEGYTVRAFLIPACGVGAWHRRARVFIVATDTNNTRGGIPGFRDYGNEPEKGERRGGIQGFESCEIYQDVANSYGTRTGEQGGNLRFEEVQKGEGGGIRLRYVPLSSGETLADTDSTGSQRHRKLRECSGELPAWESGSTIEGAWITEPNVGRVAHGVPHRVDRLRCLGNAVVPQQVYPILAGIAQIEKEIR